MQVTADNAFTAVHQHQILDAAKGAMFSGDIATYLLRTGAAVSPSDDEAEQYVADRAAEAAEPDVAEVPLGDGDVVVVKTDESDGDSDSAGELDIDATVPEVLAWVGEDQDRALVAFDAETAKGDKARSTLLKTLTDIVEN